MKVRCIKEVPGLWSSGQFTKTWWGKKKPIWNTGPQKGDIVTVSEEIWSEGFLYYKLVEWPGNVIYTAKSFEPLEEKYDTVSYEQIREKASVN